MIKYPETARFARDLSGLLRLGYSMEEAVMKSGESQSTELARIAESVANGIRKGQTLSQAMLSYEPKFPLFYRLLSSAEEGEVLIEGLNRSADILEHIADRKSQVFLAALYPATVFTLVTLGGAFFLIFSGGLFENLFMSMNLSLPVPTRILLTLCGFLSSPLGLALILLPLAVLWCVVLGKTPMADWLYRVPIFGRWLLHQEAVMFLATADQLVEQGVPLAEACRVASTVTAPSIRRKLKSVPERLESGDNLSTALSLTGLIPELGVWTIAQREQTENLRLGRVAKLLQRELDCATHTGSFVLEPFLFLLMMFGLGFFITAIMLPLYQVVGNLG